MKVAPEPKPAAENPYVHLALAPRLLKPRFYRLGVAVGRRPLTAICLSLLVTAVCASGIALTKTDTGYGMWYPRGSRAFKDQR